MTHNPIDARLLAWLQEACELVEHGLQQLPDRTYRDLQRAVDTGHARVAVRVEFEPSPCLVAKAETRDGDVELFRAGFEGRAH